MFLEVGLLSYLVNFPENKLRIPEIISTVFQDLFQVCYWITCLLVSLLAKYLKKL